MPHHLTFELADEAATLALGAALAPGIAPGRVVFLSGELGAGKTTLARGLLHALGHTGRVKSPTYTLLELYSLSRLNLYHFDFYRFRDRSEWSNSGFREHFNPDSACLVEWPEKAQDLLTAPDLWIRLAYAGEARNARLTSHSAGGAAWLQTLAAPSPAS
ncbi:MAG TPA: tRNA (adenosine(37)-N6)-threonylcarbamoyltransferase complex ATPase subunit type 1 TsaE [Burkholderiales bacterium]